MCRECHALPTVQSGLPKFFFGAYALTNLGERRLSNSGLSGGTDKTNRSYKITNQALKSVSVIDPLTTGTIAVTATKGRV